ncbi:hypothetical protein BRAS3843_1730020 [Bradyrhizobium sp. STM 3843]|nr:hypothetical protein BRAS3843_1730020 [Bradyrhizobium sp. STM 3843]
MSASPPPDVAVAAQKVQSWLDSQQRALTPDEIANLSPADRLEYTRARSQQTSMPAWKDPRATK